MNMTCVHPGCENGIATGYALYRVSDPGGSFEGKCGEHYEGELDPFAEAIERATQEGSPAVSTTLAERLVEMAGAIHEAASSDHHERRIALVKLLFESYVPHMPYGGPVPPMDQWPDDFLPLMAETPPIIDLDRRIEYGVKVLHREIDAAWQAQRS